MSGEVSVFGQLAVTLGQFGFPQCYVSFVSPTLMDMGGPYQILFEPTILPLRLFFSPGVSL